VSKKEIPHAIFAISCSQQHLLLAHMNAFPFAQISDTLLMLLVTAMNVTMLAGTVKMGQVEKTVIFVTILHCLFKILQVLLWSQESLRVLI
jgi:hypothetical protein